MLVDIPEVGIKSNHDRIFMDIISPKWKVEHPQIGVYVGPLNFGMLIPEYYKLPGLNMDFSGASELKNAEERLKCHFDYWNEREYRGTYGVCDNVEQMLAHYQEILSDPSRQFCVSFCEMNKCEQPSYGGWRWHKWGEYIGTQNRCCEYLFDEPEVESVLVFEVHFLQNC